MHARDHAYHNATPADKRLFVQRDNGDWDCTPDCGCWLPGICNGPPPLRTVATIKTDRRGAVIVWRSYRHDCFELDDIRKVVEAAIRAPLCACCRDAPRSLEPRPFNLRTCAGNTTVLALALIGLMTLETGTQEWAWAEENDD